MRIGLVRHFRVKHPFPERLLVTPTEVDQWFAQYDKADVEEAEVDLGGAAWARCFSSDLPRAVRTARRIHQGPVVTMEELREVPAYPLVKREIKLPFLLWAVLIRGAWLVNHPSQQESMVDARKRVGLALDRILSESEEDALVVSHAALMVCLRKELLARGFRGPRFGSAANGRLYIFERP